MRVNINEVWDLHPEPGSKFNSARRRKIYQLNDEELLAFSLELHEALDLIWLNGRIDNTIISGMRARLRSIQKVVNKAMSNRKSRRKKK